MKRRLTPELLSELRTQAEAWAKTYGADPEAPLVSTWHWLNGRLHPGAVVALLDALETCGDDIALPSGVGSHGEQRWHRFTKATDGSPRWVDLSRVMAYEPFDQTDGLGVLLELEGGVKLWIRNTEQEVTDAMSQRGDT